MYRTTPVLALGSMVLTMGSWAMAPMAAASVNIPFKSPSDKPAPRRASTSQGASRGGLCDSAATAESASVKALLPESHYGLTAVERPTIVAYLPETSATEVFFSLKDEAKQLHFETSLPISGKAGLFSFQLPAQAPALEPSKHYQWFLAVKCNGELRPSSPFIDGWVQRVIPNASVATIVAQAPSIAQAISLGEAGFWYDTIATLTQLKRQQPQNSEIAQSWRNFLGWTALNPQELDTLTTSNVLQ
ncbi:hypothetical protein C1752_04081 [Acaryochloris thomasi RCC1774]|uniref:DUF928 domain-containing protein n=1 Tax=Acaryochloris thomasi RCC1774 TaxID=1764569 RepID=A0A2W1JF39_9CYAN|nr:DUF928 domain-containing protein [Acaryochloris thomasi]PZD72086.1 hypothetical protein C1752_04081 [Acaryochloris thomasi RCC1774]